VHQFARIGAYVMVGGLTGVAQDVPPFVTVNGPRAEIVGLNVVGLRRYGFDQAQRTAIKQAYRILYKSGLGREAAIERLRREFSGHPEVGAIVAFVAASVRGLVSHR
jgi:UDP-N-acetylglucosamine acyltransferase